MSRKQILRLLSRLKANLKAPTENKENFTRDNKEEMKAPEPQRTPLGGIHDITDPFPINGGNDENNNQSPTSFLHPSQRSVIEKQEEEEDTLLKTDGFTRQLLGDLKDEFHGSAKSPGVEEEEAADELSNIQIEASGVGEEEGEEEEEELIDISNEEELEKRGLKKIQIEGEQEEFLMDEQGNIYDLQGNFIGTTNEEGGDSQILEGLDEPEEDEP